MSDATTPTILDIATKAISSPADLAPADITRLGTFIVDHVDHVAMHQRMLAELDARRTPVFPRGQRQDGGASLAQRLAPQAPAAVSQVPALAPWPAPGHDGEKAEPVTQAEPEKAEEHPAA